MGDTRCVSGQPEGGDSDIPIAYIKCPFQYMQIIIVALLYSGMTAVGFEQDLLGLQSSYSSNSISLSSIRESFQFQRVSNKSPHNIVKS